MQMTTDTAVRVTRMVVQDRGTRTLTTLLNNLAQLYAGVIRALTDVDLSVPLNEIPYVDSPELKLDEHESTEMPFRYVKREDGGPVMPEVCVKIELSQ
jgi:ribosome biogenesis SPOUT family RNA methylase Rps3